MMMKSGEFDISVATTDDVEGVMTLQNANLASNGGSLSAALSEEKLALMIEEMPLIIAKKKGEIVGFFLAADLKRNADIPVVKSLLKAFTGDNDAYLYGPVCVSIDQRGKGLAGRMFAELRRQLPNRQGTLFIRDDNGPSIEAHKKMGMTPSGTFSHDGADFTVFTY